MDRTEAATHIVTAMINAGAFHLDSLTVTEQSKIDGVSAAFQTIFNTVKECELNRSSSPSSVSID